MIWARVLYVVVWIDTETMPKEFPQKFVLNTPIVVTLKVALLNPSIK